MNEDERDLTVDAALAEPACETHGTTALAATPIMTREQRRSRRKREVRSRTINLNRVSKRDIEAQRLLYPELDHEKPRTRLECVEGPRPCPFVSCKHHLYLDVSARTGAIKLNFPDLEVWELGESCALDVADRGGSTLEEAGAIMNLTRERIRQVEVQALAKLEALSDMMHLRDFADAGPVGKRRLPCLSKPQPKRQDRRKVVEEVEEEERVTSDDWLSG
jgi:Sigma-70, region 4